MMYEWRTYEAMPGKFLALHTHLKVAAGLFQKSITRIALPVVEFPVTGTTAKHVWDDAVRPPQ